MTDPQETATKNIIRFDFILFEKSIILRGLSCSHDNMFQIIWKYTKMAKVKRNRFRICVIVKSTSDKNKFDQLNFFRHLNPSNDNTLDYWIMKQERTDLEIITPLFSVHWNNEWWAWL